MIDYFLDIFQNPYMINALIAGFLASFAFGVIGTYVVVKKIAIISGGIAHAVLGGLGIADYLGYPPLIGAFIFAILSAVILGIVKLKAKEHEDRVIAAIWSVGMAIGIIFMYLKKGYQKNLFTYLFGNIEYISRTEIWLLLGLDCLIFILIFIFYRKFLFISFDEEYARLRKIKVGLIYILLLCMIAVTVVALIYVIGIILVIALLTLPASISGLFTKRLFPMMLLASLLGLVFTISGLFISYSPNLPTGATIIIICGLAYLIALSMKKLIPYIKTIKKTEDTSKK